MKKVLFLILFIFLTMNAYSEGIPKGAHSCYQYAQAYLSPNSVNFLNWFDHAEYSDNYSGYSTEFLKQHSGRAGTLVWVENGFYHTGCSGTLISDKYFITAGHCAAAANIGILFGYQTKDDGSSFGSMRVTLDGYLDDNGIFRFYGQPGSEYSSFMEHPAYFPIDKTAHFYNDDRAVEIGWANVGWISKEQGIPQSAENMTWPIGDPNGKKLGKIDYAIYELEENSQNRLPANELDPWEWDSQDNQLSPQTYPFYLIKFWELPDNTNGFRGWTKVKTGRLSENDQINIMGFPGVSKNGVYAGVEVVNAGSVVGYGYELAFAEQEDVLIFKDADLMPGNSGSSVIENNHIAGVAVWTDCAPGGMANWSSIALDILAHPGDFSRLANNYATPMWKICRASKVVKKLARDQNCNGKNDWWDFILSAAFIPGSIKIGIGGNVFGTLDISSLDIPIKNYRYDKNLERAVSDEKILPPYTYQFILQDNGDVFNISKQNGVFYLSKNGALQGEVVNYPEMNGSKAVLHNNDIFLAGGYFSGSVYDYFYSGNNEVQFITKIEDNGQNGYDFLPVAEFPTNLEDVRIISLNNDIYLTGNSQSNFLIYKLVADSQSQYGYSLEIVNSNQPIRKDYNLAVSENSIFISGGATDYFWTVAQLEVDQYPDDFALFNNIIMITPEASNNWVLVAENINDINLAMNVTVVDGNNFLIFNPFVDVENSIQKVVLDLSDIPIDGDDINISFENLESGYCLKEENGAVYGGRMSGNTCTSFTFPQYHTYSVGSTVYTLAGLGTKLAVGTGNNVKIYDLTDPLYPTLVHTQSVYGPASDMLVYGNKLIVAVENGIDTINMNDYSYTHTATYGTTKALEIYNDKLYVGDGQGIKIFDPENLSLLNQLNTSGDVTQLEIIDGTIHTFEWSGLKRYDAETLESVQTDNYYVDSPETFVYNNKFYIYKNNSTVELTFSGSTVTETSYVGDEVELRNHYTFGYYTYFPEGTNVRISTIEKNPAAICGNGIVEAGEVCDSNSLACTTLDSDYDSGTAYCNSTCDGYNENDCEIDDGW